jgi:hypothetical protein
MVPPALGRVDRNLVREGAAVCPFPEVVRDSSLRTRAAATGAEATASQLVAIPGAKSQARVSMTTEVTAARFSRTPEPVRRLQLVEGDLRGAGRLVGDVTWSEGEGPARVEVTPAEASD